MDDTLIRHYSELFAGHFQEIFIHFFKAVIVLIGGWIIAGASSRIIRRRVSAAPHIDDTLGYFVANIIKWVILAVVLITVLGLFGVKTTSLVTMLGATTLAIGLALQGTLSNLAAGFMLILFRPYKLGQFVTIQGTSGTVNEINLFFTELATTQNLKVVIPNGQAWGTVITNYSAHDTRRCDLVIGIDYSNSADLAMKIILDLASQDNRILKDPEPWVRVTNLGDSSVDLTARLWCNVSDYGGVRYDMIKKIKETFDKNGISIPFNILTIQKMS